MIGVEIWLFAKSESGRVGHHEDRANPRVLNAYTASQRTSPGVSVQGLRRSPQRANGPAVPSPPLPPVPAKRWSLAPCRIAGQDPLDSRASIRLPLPCLATPDQGTCVVASVVTTHMGISQYVRGEAEPSIADRSKVDSTMTKSQHMWLGD